jgi:hypothetical protein
VHPFEPRPIEFVGLRRHAGWTLKEYSITWGSGALQREEFEAGLRLLLAGLPEPAPEAGRPGLGFLIAHRGRGADYVVLAWWDRENELPLRVAVRDGAAWRPARGGESACVWDLQVIGFERDAWVATVMAPSGADGAARYLQRVLRAP